MFSLIQYAKWDTCIMGYLPKSEADLLTEVWIILSIMRKSNSTIVLLYSPGLIFTVDYRQFKSSLHVFLIIAETFSRQFSREATHRRIKHYVTYRQFSMSSQMQDTENYLQVLSESHSRFHRRCIVILVVIVMPLRVS